MNDMIEKVANSIAVADLNASAKSMPDVPMETMAEYVRLAVEEGHYQAMARAAIEAMREPTEAMQNAAIAKIGHEVDWVSGLFGGAYDAGAHVLSDGYSAMIDAALNGKEG